MVRPALGVDQLRGSIVDDPEQGGFVAQPGSRLVLRQADRRRTAGDRQCLDDDFQWVGGDQFGGLVGGDHSEPGTGQHAASTEACQQGVEPS